VTIEPPVRAPTVRLVTSGTAAAIGGRIDAIVSLARRERTGPTTR
jgi:hypothetical protein